MPTEELDAAVEGLVGGWLDGRARRRELSRRSRDRLSDDELGALAGREPVAGSERRGGGMSIELFDELEAGELSVEFEGEEPEEVLDWALERFAPRHRALDRVPGRRRRAARHGVAIDPDVRVFSVDTGRLPQETYELVERLRQRYPELRLELLSPDAAQLQRLVARTARTSSTDSVEQRLICCNVRKVQPLTRHLQALDAWITGLRRDQWATRTNIRKVEIDHDHGAIVKLNPLAEWTEEEVWDYVRENEVPYHPLYERGYTSIGCAPCTRAIAPGEAARAGRWWWETTRRRSAASTARSRPAASSTSCTRSSARTSMT